MKFLNVKRGFGSFLILMALTHSGCSGSGSGEDILNGLFEGAANEELNTPDLSGAYSSNCLSDAFGVNYKTIDLEINGDDVTYTENRYGDFGCVIPLDVGSSEVTEGSLEAREELPGGGFFYQFLIPIDENVSAVRLLNILKQEDRLIISRFFFHDDEFDMEENQPEITMFPAN